MKKINFLSKIFIIIVALLIINTPTSVHAFSWADLFSQANSWIEDGKNPTTTGENGDEMPDEDMKLDQGKIKEASDTMFNILLGVGSILTVIVGGILGIQFMMASAEDKAKVKEAFIPYVIGSFVIFGSFAIWELVTDLLQGLAL